MPMNMHIYIAICNVFANTIYQEIFVFCRVAAQCDSISCDAKGFVYNAWLSYLNIETNETRIQHRKQANGRLQMAGIIWDKHPTNWTQYD